MADTLKGFDEVFVIPACFLRIHLVSLHTSVDHFEWICEESSHKTTEKMSVDVEISTAISTWIMDHFVIEVEETTGAGGGVGESSEKEGMNIAVELAESATCFMDLSEDTEGRISTIERDPLEHLPFLHHDLAHLHEIQGLCECV